MEYSKNYDFYLPSRDSDDIADINQISENFRIIDGKLAFLERDQLQIAQDIEGLGYVLDDKINRTEAKEVFASAIRNTASGSIVSLTDISPLEHTLSVKARSKNLIPYPFSNSTTTINGITFTDNGDGTITVNGTATENAVYYFRWDTSNPLTLPKGVYTLSGSPVGSVYETYYLGFAYTNGETDKDAGAYEEGKTVELEKVRAIYIGVRKGVTADNLIFKPQLEEGSIATPYTSFVPIGTIIKTCTIEENAKAYISITDIDKCIAKSKAEGRTYANGIESFEIRFSSEGDGFYWVGEWNGNEAELLEQWGIKMLKKPEADQDSYRFRLFYKDGTNLNAVVAGKNFAQVNSLKTPTSEKTIIFSGEITGDFVFSCNINCECTNMGGTMFGVTIDGKEKDITPYAIIGNPNGYLLSGTITQIKFINYSVCKEGSIDNIQLEPGTIKTDFEPHNKLTTHSINADGTVEGVTSIYPTTTITSDTEGVVFDVGYNADTKKYIDNKFAELAALIVNS